MALFHSSSILSGRTIQEQTVQGNENLFYFRNQTLHEKNSKVQGMANTKLLAFWLCIYEEKNC